MRSSSDLRICRLRVPSGTPFIAAHQFLAQSLDELGEVGLRRLLPVVLVGPDVVDADPRSIGKLVLRQQRTPSKGADAATQTGRLALDEAPEAPDLLVLGDRPVGRLDLRPACLASPYPH